MKISIIGSGSIAGEHATGIRALHTQGIWTDVGVDSVVGRQPAEVETFARTHELRLGTTNLDLVLSDPTVDAVIVTTPTDLHAAHTEAALRAGKHVLCEIPLATSLAETDRLIALADERDLRLMVCQTQRSCLRLDRSAKNGCRRRNSCARRRFAISLQSAKQHQLEGPNRSWTDNLLWHHTCHAVDATLWLLGSEVVETSAQIAPADPVTGIPMDISILMRTALDQIVTVVTSYHAIIPQHDYLLIGDETSIQFINRELHSPAGLLVPAIGDDPLPDALPRQNAEFFAAIRERREPSVSGRSVRPAMAVLQYVQDQLDARS